MKLTLILAVLLSLMVGCSDFTNKSSSDEGDGGGGRKLENNQFPENFNPNEGEFSEYNMLANIGLNVIQPRVKTLRLHAELMSAKINSYCQALKDGSNHITKEEAAKNYWKETMLSFHFVDAAPLGPQVDRGDFIGNNIYAWPHISTCGIDVEVERMSREANRNGQLVTSLKGLGAIEYLLFEPSLTSECPLARYPKIQTWLNKEERMKKSDRCEFALMLSEEVMARSKDLEAEWDQNGSNYSRTLVENREIYPTLKDSVTAMSDALFSLERVKDERLGMPLGIHADCTNPSGKCLDKVEHPWSGLGLQAIEARIQGFQHIFWGASTPDGVGYGFDDYLKQMGRSDVASTMTQSSQVSLQKWTEVYGHGDLKSQVQQMDVIQCKSQAEAVPICSLHQKVKAISDSLKTEFLTALSLRAPPTRAGDMD